MGFSTAEVATAEKWPEQKIIDWENGKGSPSLPQLRRLAKRYKRPLMVFYLEKPPTDFPIVRDFRLLPKNASREYTPELNLALRMAQEKQAWAAEYFEDAGFPRSPFLRIASLSSRIIDVAQNLRNSLGVTIETQVSCNSDSEAFSIWKRQAEALGFFVFQASGVSVEEMRGCALANAYAPTVLINSQDAYTAKTFTLIHELTHILLGSSAVTGGRDGSATESVEKTERFCNSVAAEVVVPYDDFSPRVKAIRSGIDLQHVTEFARRYRVSRAMISYRVVEVGAASRSWLDKVLPLVSGPSLKKSSGPIPQHTLALSRNGAAFSRLAVSAYDAGAIHGGELSGLLSMKLKHLPKLMEQIFPHPVDSASA